MQARRKSPKPSPAVIAALEEAANDLVLLDGLSGEEVRQLARGATRFDALRGEVLFRQGEPCAGLLLLLDGQVKLAVHTARGHERVIELVGAPGSLGEMALLLKQPYRTTAEVISGSTLVALGTEAVLEQITHNTRFLRNLLREVCRRLNQRTRDLESCLLLTGRQRVIGFLLTQPSNGDSLSDSAVVTLPAKKSIIASRLNLTQEHFSRILHDMQAGGLIEVRGRNIHLLDNARLSDFRQ
jgi:CRP-like cAMP-binding protein